MTSRIAAREIMDTLPDVVRRSAERYPDATALAPVPLAGGWSYAELRALMERGANLLRTICPAGGPVLLFLEPCAAWPVAFFSILEAGMTAVPLPAESPLATAAGVTAFAGARLGIVSRRTCMLGQCSGLRCLPIDELLEAGAVPTAKPAMSSEPAVLAFTSGSTSQPRAVELTHANLLANLHGLLRVRQAKPGDSFLSMLPPAHLFELMVGLLGPLACGARVFYAGTLLPHRVVAALREERITHALAVPALLQVLYEEIVNELIDSGVLEPARRDQSPAETARRLKEMGKQEFERMHASIQDRIGACFENIVIGGAALDPAWADVTAALGLRLEVGYGLTEAGPIVSVALASEAPPGSAGRPLPSVEIRLADDGEILVRGPGVMRGYFRDPDATAAALRDGWLHTGDHGHLDADGFLFITGRLKEALKTACGETLYPEEIEPYYHSQLFAEYCVSGLPGPQGNDIPTLFVVPAAPDVGDEELRRAFDDLRTAAPPRLRVASMIRLTTPLPRTPLGKIRRRCLGPQLPKGGFP
jgi:long-chain acyl-CoA synthetase